MSKDKNDSKDSSIRGKIITLSFSSFSMSETRFRIKAHAVLAIFFPSYFIRDLSVLVFPSSLVVLLFEEFPCAFLRQSFALCPMI